MIANCFDHIGRFLLSAVFIASGLSHLQNPHQFLDSVLRYELVGGFVALLVAVVLPFIQLMLGLLLLFDGVSKPALLFSGILLVLFLVAQGSVIVRGIKIACGCFGGVTSHDVGTLTLLFDVSLLILVLLLSLNQRKTISGLTSTAVSQINLSSK